MAEFNLREYNLILIRLYRKDQDEISRLLEDLEYYMLETKDKYKYLYIVAANKFDIYLIYKSYETQWDFEKLNLIVSNVLKSSTYMFINVNGYQGLMGTDFWKELKESVEYFNDVKKFRKKLKKIEASEELIVKELSISIDDILNKINDKGIESLTEDEKQILKNHKDENN